MTNNKLITTKVFENLIIKKVMKLTIEQKAKAYDEAIKKARIYFEQANGNEDMITMAVTLFTELKESEDEKIRNALVELVHDTTGDSLWVDYNVHKEDAIAWLENQGKQKTANKIEPKFKVGDTIRLKDGDGLEWTVEEVLNNGYYTIVCADRDDFIQLDDNWELVEQKPAWSEERIDEINRKIFPNHYGGTKVLDTYNPVWSEEDEKKNEDEAIRSNSIPELPSSAFRLGFKLGWFKALRPQNTWKPSDEQMDNK